MISQTERLIEDANEEYKILMGNGRYIPANLLKFEISQLKSRVEALRIATIDIVIRGLELDIKTLSIRLNTDIYKFKFMPNTFVTTPHTTSKSEVTPSHIPITAVPTVSSTKTQAPKVKTFLIKIKT